MRMRSPRPLLRRHCPRQCPRGVVFEIWQELFREWLHARLRHDGALDTRCARCPERGVFGTMRPEGMPQGIMRGNPDWALPTFV